MKGLRPMMLAGFVAIGSLGLVPSAARAQGRVVAAYPRTYVVPGYSYPATRPAPTYRRYAPAGPRFAARRTVIVPHAVHDWSTGNENLPLAKPWLHNFR